MCVCFLVVAVLPTVAFGNENATAHHWVPPLLSVVPFGVILCCIAFLPLMPLTEHWWERNSNRALVSAILGLPVVVYVLMHNVHHVQDTGLEYFQFLSLLATLYIVAGGIHITGNLLAKPSVNTCIMMVGYCIASIIGTTGAAMVLIFPLLKTNRERVHKRHTVVFFIILVCNLGGLLSPIGDPPLFLGYLRGISFFWFAEHLWWIWIVAGLVLLPLYFCLDVYWYRKEPAAALFDDEEHEERLGILGKPNLIFLFAIVLSVACAVPTPFRELVMWTMAAASLLYWKTTVGARARSRNKFDFHAIVEVAIVFAGIFATMMPALMLLGARGGELGVNTPLGYFWATGVFSSILDNAPTFLCFLELCKSTVGVEHASELMSSAPQILAGLSVGAVYFGAMTYIGNAPNFMVRAIAEQRGVRMPSFVGYTFKWSIPLLLPLFVVIGLLLAFV